MVFDVNSGEIVAMVSLPDFDPNAPATTTSEAMFNRATLGVYEMGSTFKLFNTATALDSGKASMTSTYDAAAPIHISRFTISDYHNLHRALSVPEILIHSSNIGSARMAVDFGIETQKLYMGRFGMLKPVSIELPELGAPLVPSPWREINAMTIAYGHGIAVTPLQVVAGVASLINGGNYIHPTVLKRQPGAELPSAQVLKPQTSENMRRLMRMVVTQGTGSKAEVAGYEVGGKTGTAEKLGGAGGYRKKSLLSSFVGAFPMSNPRYVVVVWVDEPQGTRETYGFATGGWTAAPVVGRVVAQIAPMLGIRPTPPDGRVQEAVMVREDVDLGETE
jgi:cell division protein FtsI (penicillin-binding protein 3)